jgi:hypothetical protein
MSTNQGFWRKVAGAFVEFDDAGAAAPTPAPSGPPSGLDAEIADADRLLRELQAGAPTSSAAPSAPGASSPPEAAPPFAEGRPLPELYAEAGVPAAAQSAEQLLAILDGLAALPPEARRLAVKAMDDADDRWSVADVYDDARRKTEALVGYLHAAERSVADVQARVAAERAQVDKVLLEAEAEIEKQIAALQAELASFRSDAAAQHQALEAQVQAAREGLTRESTRVQSEVTRLGRVATFLSPMTSATPEADAPTRPPGA